MLGLSLTENLLWIVTFGMEAGLLLLLISRKQHREFPFFSAYLSGVLLQTALLFASYSLWGFDSRISVRVAWISQGFVTLLRALVVVELCRRLVGPYRGVWALTWRVLLSCACIVLSYSFLVSRFAVQVAIVNIDRGLELTIATVVVVVFLFAAYYGIVPQTRIYFLSAGLCFYSCFYVVNDSFLEHWMEAFSNVWNFMGMLSFLASLGLWLWGFLIPQASETSSAELLPRHIYGSLSPRLNRQLSQLNQRLSMFWQIEEPLS